MMRFLDWKKFALLLAMLAGVAACGGSFRQEAYDLLREQRYFEAEYYLARAIDIDPEDANARLSLGVVYLHTYREDEARRIFSDLVSSDPNVAVEADLEPGFRDGRVSRLASYYLTRLDGEPDSAYRPGEKVSAERNIADAARDGAAFPSATSTQYPGPEGAQPDSAAAGAGQGGAWGVHVFSVQDEAGTARVEKEMRQRFPSLFPSAPFLSRRVDLGKKGIFLRVIAGPYPSKAAAKAACVPLRKAYSFCQVLPY